jgi:hypothetical protein
MMTASIARQLFIIVAIFIILARTIPEASSKQALWLSITNCGAIGISSSWKPKPIETLVANLSES